MDINGVCLDFGSLMKRCYRCGSILVEVECQHIGNWRDLEQEEVIAYKDVDNNIHEESNMCVALVCYACLDKKLSLPPADENMRR